MATIPTPEQGKPILDFSAGTFDGNSNLIQSRNGAMEHVNGDDVADYVNTSRIYNGLDTTAKTTVGAINEVNAKDASDIPYDNTSSGLTATDVNAAIDELKSSINALLNARVYGFNINFNTKEVTYIAGAVGMTPAYMDYTNDSFNYGSWQNAFFMPRPCMLNYDGTVAYYLDPTNYAYKEDGVTASDVNDSRFGGNAMMEWGRDGKRIWYKQVAELDGSTSVYISDYQLDSDYHAWSFYDAEGTLKEHFYTPIFNGSIVNGVLRSIGGIGYENLCQGKTGAQEIAAAELNNVGNSKHWYIEVVSDIILICHLLTLIGKSLNTSLTYGNGRTGQTSAASSMLGTGTMNNKGLFWGSNTGDYGVKVFGMENFWGNQYRRTAGLVLKDNKWYYKLTRSINDGSTATDYNSDGTNYLTQNHTAPASNYAQEMFYTSDGAFYTKATNATVGNTMYQDYFYANASGARYLFRGGSCDYSADVCGAFYLYVYGAFSNAHWHISASLSYK